MELDYDITQIDLDIIRCLLIKTPYCNNNIDHFINRILHSKRYICTRDGDTYLAFKMSPQYHVLLNRLKKSWSIIGTGKH